MGAIQSMVLPCFETPVLQILHNLHVYNHYMSMCTTHLRLLQIYGCYQSTVTTTPQLRQLYIDYSYSKSTLTTSLQQLHVYKTMGLQLYKLLYRLHIETLTYIATIPTLSTNCYIVLCSDL